MYGKCRVFDWDKAARWIKNDNLFAVSAGTESTIEFDERLIYIAGQTLMVVLPHICDNKDYPMIRLYSSKQDFEEKRGCDLYCYKYVLEYERLEGTWPKSAMDIFNGGNKP